MTDDSHRRLFYSAESHIEQFTLQSQAANKKVKWQNGRGRCFLCMTLELPNRLDHMKLITMICEIRAEASGIQAAVRAHIYTLFEWLYSSENLTDTTSTALASHLGAICIF